jgi:hypothetical protein
MMETFATIAALVLLVLLVLIVATADQPLRKAAKDIDPVERELGSLDSQSDAA